jgi:hypothetical protein
MIPQVVPSDSETFYKKYIPFSISAGIPLNRSNHILDTIIQLRVIGLMVVDEKALNSLKYRTRDSNYIQARNNFSSWSHVYYLPYPPL